MKLRFTLRIIGCTLLTVLTTTTVIAQTLPYGTARKPHTCQSTTEPKTGAPSVEQAKKYFLCDEEWESSIPKSLWLITDLTLQVAPVSRPVNGTDLKYNTRLGGVHLSMNTDKPVYDIRGSFTRHICHEIKRYNPVGKNCSVEQFPNSTGICFRNTFGDWHCRMTGSTKKVGDHLPPPQS